MLRRDDGWSLFPNAFSNAPFLQSHKCCIFYLAVCVLVILLCLMRSAILIRLVYVLSDTILFGSNETTTVSRAQLTRR
jgi:predicted signal transduction protein with EAL and GGDEF domain